MYTIVAANVCIALSRDNLFSWKMLESSYGSIFTIIGTSSFASGFTLQFFEGSVLSQSVKDKNLKSIFLSGAAVCALSLSTKVVMLGVDPKIIYALNGVALVLGIAAEVYKSQKHDAPSLAI